MTMARFVALAGARALSSDTPGQPAGLQRPAGPPA